MFSYDPSNRILKVQKLAEEEVDLGLLEYQKESYQKYLTETIYSDMEYLLQVMRELLQVSQVDAEFRVGDLYCGNYKNEVKKKSPSYYPVYAKFTIDGAVFPNEVEVFRIPAMDEDGILNFNGDRRVLLMQMVAAERVSYAADKQTVSMRKMWHATSPYVITCDDCGTTEGIEIKKSDIAMFLQDSGGVDEIFCKIITGRYQAGTNIYIDKRMASELCKNNASVTIRSPISCKDPCCKKCYGDDPSTHRLAAIGLPIGFIAAHSIGEPGTQLSMDSFKKGGIASKGGVTSSFAKLEAYIECKNLADNKNFGTYDPIAWESGEVHETFYPDGSKKVTIGDSRIAKRLPAEAPLRKVAVKGQGLCMERGD